MRNKEKMSQGGILLWRHNGALLLLHAIPTTVRRLLLNTRTSLLFQTALLFFVSKFPIPLYAKSVFQWLM
jgi:hypothetical protein